MKRALSTLLAAAIALVASELPNGKYVCVTSAVLDDNFKVIKKIPPTKENIKKFGFGYTKNGETITDVTGEKFYKTGKKKGMTFYENRAKGVKHIALIFKDGSYEPKKGFLMLVASPRVNYTATCLALNK